MVSTQTALSCSRSDNLLPHSLLFNIITSKLTEAFELTRYHASIGDYKDNLSSIKKEPNSYPFQFTRSFPESPHIDLIVPTPKSTLLQVNHSPEHRPQKRKRLNDSSVPGSIPYVLGLRKAPSHYSCHNCQQTFRTKSRLCSHTKKCNLLVYDTPLTEVAMDTPTQSESFSSSSIPLASTETVSLGVSHDIDDTSNSNQMIENIENRKAPHHESGSKTATSAYSSSSGNQSPLSVRKSCRKSQQKLVSKILLDRIKHINKTRNSSKVALRSSTKLKSTKKMVSGSEASERGCSDHELVPSLETCPQTDNKDGASCPDEEADGKTHDSRNNECASPIVQIAEILTETFLTVNEAVEKAEIITESLDEYLPDPKVQFYEEEQEEAVTDCATDADRADHACNTVKSEIDDSNSIDQSVTNSKESPHQPKTEVVHPESSSNEIVPSVSQSVEAEAKPSNYYCTHCNCKFQSLWNARRHNYTVHGIGTPLTSDDLAARQSGTECPVCNKVDEKPPEVSSKQRKELRNCSGVWICGVCGISFSRRDSLIEHGKIHIFDDLPKPQLSGLYKCMVCGAVHPTHLTLMKHIEKKHNPSLTCSTCYEVFASSIQLRSHHCGSDVLISCRHCPKKFGSHSAHTKHMKTFHSALTISLGQSSCKLCDYTFSSVLKYKAHQTVAHPTPDAKCQVCDMTCQSRDALTQHILSVHIDVLPFLCTVCEEGFKSQDELTTHRAQHFK